MKNMKTKNFEGAMEFAVKNGDEKIISTMLMDKFPVLYPADLVERADGMIYRICHDPEDYAIKDIKILKSEINPLTLSGREYKVIEMLGKNGSTITIDMEWTPSDDYMYEVTVCSSPQK